MLVQDTAKNVGGVFYEKQCRLRSYISRHCDTTQFTLTHHMVNKPFLLLGLAAEYRSRRRRLRCANNIAADHHMLNTGRPTKLTALETISR